MWGAAEAKLKAMALGAGDDVGIDFYLFLSPVVLGTELSLPTEPYPLPLFYVIF